LESVVRPANAHAIPYRERYVAAQWQQFSDMSPPQWSLYSFLKAKNVAASVAGLAFDVVDLPDYEQFGMFLRPALVDHRVSADRVVLSLHGRISTSINLNWRTEGMNCRQVTTQEDMQFRTVDLRYGLSRDYIDEWRNVTSIESHYLSPLRFLAISEPRAPCASASRPDIVFIGRSEKRKGPDIFVDLAWWLPRESYHRAAIIGPESIDPEGIGSSEHLGRMAESRFGSQSIEMLPAMTTAQLQEVFASRSVTILPSRYDTFNLCAAESLLAGCPTAIGDGAGVCRFLEETFPGVPFLKIDTHNIYAAIPPLIDVLKNYDPYRQQLVAALKAANPEIAGPSLVEIYDSSPNFDGRVRNELNEWYDRLMSNARGNTRSVPRRAVQLLRRVALLQSTQRRRARMAAWSVKTTVIRQMRASRLRPLLKAASAVRTAKRMANSYREIHVSAEETATDVEQKIRRCEHLVSYMRIDRVRLWRELARLEELRGRNLVAATYRLRAMRLFGHDQFGDLPPVMETLQEYGFSREAAAADAIYGLHLDRVDRCANILNTAFSSNQQSHDWNYELVDDRRNGSPCRVSVIVSLYNAADKLPMFLEALSLQTLVRAGQAELILVDSGSTTSEYAVFRQAVEQLRIPAIYVRCAHRETIQSAWNRGISLARAPYLSFLGVDEGVLPQGLEVLARELDSDPSLDWVQANSLVTNVGDRGSWLSDVMTYDRTNYRQPFVYLDTCYLSWVGALYRRSIHDRFGMYDTSFNAAGDTEFKNRVLPLIRSKVLPETLGVFWNYPSDRMTCSPRAEIEDLRAWYLHRTLAGVRYAFRRHDPREAEDLFYATLRYRKSFCSHFSTDIDYAQNLSLYLEQNGASASVTNYFGGVRRLLDSYRRLDCITPASPHSFRSAILSSAHRGRQVAKEHQRLSRQQIIPVYTVFNDNRHEQHNQLWSEAA
jgi:glycosyltransferase involved in cell wall biosynthesis